MSTEIPRLKICKAIDNKHLISGMMRTLNSLLINTPEDLNREKVKHVSELVKHLKKDCKPTVQESEEGEVSCEIKRLEKLRIKLEKKFQIQDKPVMEIIL